MPELSMSASTIGKIVVVRIHTDICAEQVIAFARECGATTIHDEVELIHVSLQGEILLISERALCERLAKKQDNPKSRKRVTILKGVFPDWYELILEGKAPPRRNFYSRSPRMRPIAFPS